MRKLPTNKSANNQKTKRKSNLPIEVSVERAWKLADKLLISMEVGLHSDASSDEWKRLFGTKDSAVVCLQKLVMILGLLSNQTGITDATDESTQSNTLSQEEMELLTEWLAGAGKEV